MIIEGIVTWFIALIQYAVSLLPANGSIFQTIPDLSFSTFKYITLLNGYMPVKELGTVFLIMIAVQASIMAIRITLGIFNQLTKLIP